MRIIDCSSDVCSSDLRDRLSFSQIPPPSSTFPQHAVSYSHTTSSTDCYPTPPSDHAVSREDPATPALRPRSSMSFYDSRENFTATTEHIGRASCRASVCQYG